MKFRKYVLRVIGSVLRSREIERKKEVAENGR